MLKSLLLLSLAPFVYSSAPPDPNPPQGNEKLYKCRQFRLSLSKPDGKDAHFNVSTKTLLKRFAVSKKEVVVRESDLPKQQPPLQGEEGGSDVQETNLTDVVVVEKPARKPFWQKTLRWIYGGKILVFGVHVDGEVSDEKQHGKVNLSGALCSPYTPELDQGVENLVEAATEVAGQIVEGWASSEEEGERPVLQAVAPPENTTIPQNTAPTVRPISSVQVAIVPPSGQVVQDTEPSVDQQVPIVAVQSEGQSRLISVSQPPPIPSTQTLPLHDDINDISINVMAPKEIRGIRDYVAK